MDRLLHPDSPEIIGEDSKKRNVAPYDLYLGPCFESLLLLRRGTERQSMLIPSVMKDAVLASNANDTSGGDAIIRDDV